MIDASTYEIGARARIGSGIAKDRLAMRSVIRAGAARSGTLLISLALIAITNRITVANLGVDAFGVVSLISTLPALLPFADLGLGATIVSEVPNQSRSRAQLIDMIRRINRVLWMVSLTCIGVAIVTWSTDIWPTVLGVPDDSWVSPSTSASLVLFGLSIRFGVGARILIALDKAHIATIFLLAGPTVALTFTVGASALGLSPVFYVIGAPAGVAMANLLMLIFARKISGFPVFSKRRVTLPHNEIPITLHGHSMPMVVISVMTPLLFQSDRILLAQFAPPVALAAYSIAAQLYWPAYSVLSTAGAPLWPAFIRIRDSEHRLRVTLARALITFFGIGALAAIGLCLMTPLYQAFIGAADTQGVESVTYWFAILLITQAVAIPLCGLLTTPRGLGIQATLSVAMLILKTLLFGSVLTVFVAAAPVVGSVAAVALQLAVLIVVAFFWLHGRPWQPSPGGFK